MAPPETGSGPPRAAAPPSQWRVAGMTVRLLREPGAEQERYERDLAARGIDVPLMHRAAWARSDRSQAMWFLAVLDADGACACGTGVEVIRRRALPGTLSLRASRFGAASHDTARDAALHALLELATHRPRVVRLHVEIFSFDEGVRRHMEASLEALGFRRAEHPRCYEETVVIDLRPDEQAILAAFHPTARRHMKAVDKHPVSARVIEDARHARAMDRLMRETMARTGGDLQRTDWSQRIAFSREYPGLSRIVGLFRDDDENEGALLAFAWACMHGKTAQYTAAASTRPSDLHMPLGYALAWDLIAWARREGAQIFDFGGITRGCHADGDDVLGGVSDFKRYFTTERRRVGSEWIYSLRPALAKAGDVISNGVRRLRP